VGETRDPDPGNSLLIFLILHLLVYPASNGYNSYMDRDEESIGGVKHPLQPTIQLFYVSLVLDLVAILLSFLVSYFFVMCVVLYILASRAYSFRGIRLKKYPVIGYLTVMIFQGGVTFIMVYHGADVRGTMSIPLLPVLASSLLIGGFYPLTQIYQHKADLKDGVKTISYVLGYKGTFIFTAIVYTFAMGLLAQYFYSVDQENKIFILATLMVPVLVYFFSWAAKVWRDTNQANFKNTMRMNLIASVCTNLGFLTLLIRRFFE
jgi:1,4-dihydroxy-2-naphthoate octaprenyltransferase